tara:strand:+ start:1377 stop:1907 length:531 start_codon:yes stop_codon:yes gene_type:complete
MEEIKSKIRTIPNWPKEGIMFRDITTLLLDSNAFNKTMDLLFERYKDKEITSIAGIESRGFIFGSVLASKLRVAFIPIRKKGKLPGEVIQQEYELEYGTDVMEIHTDAISSGDSVLIVDDLIATGGTALAACNLVESAGGKVVECSFIVDLPDLGGMNKLKNNGYNVFNLIEFEGE